MLVLERGIGEIITIGPDIEIMVTDIRRKGSDPVVRIGIKAPMNVHVDRKEIAEAKAACKALGLNGRRA